MGKRDSAKNGCDTGVSLPWAFKLDHLQPVEVIQFPNFSQFKPHNLQSTKPWVFAPDLAYAHAEIQFSTGEKECRLVLFDVLYRTVIESKSQVCPTTQTFQKPHVSRDRFRTTQPRDYIGRSVNFRRISYNKLKLRSQIEISCAGPIKLVGRHAESAFSFRSDNMRFSFALFVLAVVVIASCAAQPQGNARAAALDAGNVPSDRRKLQKDSFYREVLFPGFYTGNGSIL